jgi:hypothetical protein
LKFNSRQDTPPLRLSDVLILRSDRWPSKSSPARLSGREPTGKIGDERKWFARFSINGSFHQPFSALIRRYEKIAKRSHRFISLIVSGA